MAAFLDGCRFNPTAGGTTDWTYSSAVTGYQSPSAAQAVNGGVYRYRAESADLSQWELGTTTYNSGTGVFARTNVLYNSSGSGSAQGGAGTKINFATIPQVAVVALAEDLLSFDTAMSLTSAQELQAANNLMVISAAGTQSLSSIQQQVARLNIGAIGIVKYQIFTAAGTYTPDPHLIIAWARGVAAGGGGGGQAGPGAGAAEGAAGGGSGSYSEKLMTPAMIGASQSILMGTGGAAGASGGGTGGTGGNAAIGTLMTMNGGVGGGGNGLSAGGAGGAAGTGDVAIPGNNGESGKWFHAGSLNPFAGAGANSHFGAGGIPGFGNGSAVSGTAGTGFGSGGSGASAQGTSASAAGGAGRPPYIVILELCSQ